MTIEVLVSTMHQNDYLLLKKMNIQSDAIIVNQCDKNEITEFEYEGHKIRWISLAERGVGLSRNTCLMRSAADILLFADDDVVYNDGYAEKVCQEFDSHKDMDMIMFNLQSLNPSRLVCIDKKKHRINYFNSLKYGSCRIAVKRETAFRKNLYFSLFFGGGARYQAGEDNLFITEALKKKCRLMASDIMLGTVAQEKSVWFHGYDSKYYKDRGALFAAMYGKWAVFMTLLFEAKKTVEEIISNNKNKNKETLSLKQFEEKKTFAEPDIKKEKLPERLRFHFQGMREFEK